MCCAAFPEQMAGHHFTKSVWKILVGLKQEKQIYYFDKNLEVLGTEPNGKELYSFQNVFLFLAG